MTGIIEQYLCDRLGHWVEEVEQGGLVVRRWLPKEHPMTSRLFYNSPGGPVVPALQRVYGSAHAGILAGRALKLAAFGPPVPFGVPEAAGYRRAPELVNVFESSGNLVFFMDAANVYFYGMSNGMVVEYDAETGELDDSGEPESAVPAIIDSWLRAADS
jgi:hypothetical protein